MPSSYSISLANTKVRLGAFALAYFVAMILYRESFGGSPVWDDMTFWFFDPNFGKQSYSEVWTYSTWPFTLTVQKLLFGAFGFKYWVYHVFNFFIHSVNAWLVYAFLRTLGLARLWAFAGFALFLLHPANVIAVSWMIQFKTLLCFTFGMAAIVVFLRRKGPKSTVLAYLLYLLSILSKSSSLPLPLAILFLSERPLFRKKNLALIPFFLIASFGAYRINFSNLALEGVKDALETTGKGFPKTSPLPQLEEAAPEGEAFSPVPDEPMVKPRVENPDFDKNEPTKSLVELSPIQAKRRLFIKTLNYYFWQAYVPVNNVPVKGQNPYPPKFWDYLHLIFLSILVLITARFQVFYLLAAGMIFLLPYLGLIPAPYMNITWVSDQHLYIALPFFIALFICLIDRMKQTWKATILSIVLVFYAVKVNEASTYYKDNFSFYGASIEKNYNNIPLVYNLSILYIANDRRADAIELLETVLTISKSEEYLRDNRFFPYLVNLHSQLTQTEKD